MKKNIKFWVSAFLWVAS